MTNTNPNEAILTEPRLTTKEAAARLGICIKTTLRKIATGEIGPVFRPHKRGIGSIMIPESSLRSYELRTLRQGAPGKEAVPA